MTREETLGALLRLDAAQDMELMIDLGMHLTIGARGAYPLEHTPGRLEELIGFNELQHQLYGRIRHVRHGEEWTIESFFDGLVQKAAHYGIGGELRWAVTRTLERVVLHD